MPLTQQRLKELLSYDPDTGAFTWLVTTSNRAPAGTRAGSSSHEYVTIRVDKRRYPAHRLAWLYMTGGWPEAQIDHRDQDRSNNRWANLRGATLTENNRNTGTRRNNSTGYKGVSRHGPTFRAECLAEGQRVRKSGFATASDASNWITQQRARLHGEFANHGALA